MKQTKSIESIENELEVHPIFTLGYFPSMNLWTTDTFLTKLSEEELVEIHRSVNMEMYSITGGSDGTIVKQLRPKALWSQRFKYMDSMMKGRMIGVDKYLNKVVAKIRGYDLKLKLLWPVYKVLECVMETNRRIFNEDSLCTPCNMTDLKKKMQEVNVSFDIVKIMRTELPTSETVSSCMSEYFRYWILLQKNICKQKCNLYSDAF